MLQMTYLSTLLLAVIVFKDLPVICCTVVLSQLTKSRVVQVGEIIEFICPHPTDLLYHRPPRSEVSNYTLVLSASNSTRHLEGPRWSADVTETAVTWTIASGERSNAGNYRCADEGEVETGTMLQLIVIEAPPTCHSSTEDWQKVDCDTQSESNVTLTCAMTFYGDTSPVMNWRESGRRGNIAPSYYEEENSTATSHLLVPPGKKFTCIVSFSSLESQFSYTCQPMAAHPCGIDGTGGIQSLTDSYLVLIVTSIVIISLSICLCVFYVITFVWINWRSPVSKTRKGEKLNEVPIIDLNGGDDNASDVDDGADAPTEVGESSQTTSV